MPSNQLLIAVIPPIGGLRLDVLPRVDRIREHKTPLHTVKHAFLVALPDIATDIDLGRAIEVQRLQKHTGRDAPLRSRPPAIDPGITSAGIQKRPHRGIIKQLKLIRLIGLIDP